MTCTTDDDETFDCTWTIEELTETRMKATQYTKETYEGSVCEEFDTMLFRAGEIASESPGRPAAEKRDETFMFRPR